MVKKLKNAFSISDLWVSSNEKTSDFYLTSWQRGDSAIPMFLVRLLLSSVSVGILVWSLVVGAGPFWMIYLTNWGLLLLTSLTLSGLLVSCFAICKKIPGKFFAKTYDHSSLFLKINRYLFIIIIIHK